MDEDPFEDPRQELLVPGDVVLEQGSRTRDVVLDCRRAGDEQRLHEGLCLRDSGCKFADLLLTPLDLGNQHLHRADAKADGLDESISFLGQLPLPNLESPNDGKLSGVGVAHAPVVIGNQLGEFLRVLHDDVEDVEHALLKGGLRHRHHVRADHRAS